MTYIFQYIIMVQFQFYLDLIKKKIGYRIAFGSCALPVEITLEQGVRRTFFQRCSLDITVGNRAVLLT